MGVPPQEGAQLLTSCQMLLPDAKVGMAGPPLLPLCGAPVGLVNSRRLPLPGFLSSTELARFPKASGQTMLDSEDVFSVYLQSLAHMHTP